MILNKYIGKGCVEINQALDVNATENLFSCKLVSPGVILKKCCHWLRRFHATSSDHGEV